MIAPAIALVALAWLALLVVTPISPAPLATLMYTLGGYICHQLPERSFHLGGFQLPVCGRCLGIYAGVAIAAGVHVRARAATSPLSSLVAQTVFFLGALPSIVTFGLEWSGVWRGTNFVRAVAGAALGLAVAFVVMNAVATLHYSSCGRRRPTEPSQVPPTYLICAAAWLIPGAGHLWLGRRRKGIAFLIAQTLMFAFGLWLEGALFPFQLSEPLVALGAMADLGIGLPYFVARATGAGDGTVTAITYEYGNTFMIVAGLLNMLIVLDVFDIAKGRK